MVSGQWVENDARVEAVVPNHMEASLGQTALVLQHAVQVLQMKKGRGAKATDQHQSIEQSTIRGASGKVHGGPVTSIGGLRG